MDDSDVSIPVSCPTCGSEHFAEVPLAVIQIALSKWNNMRLHAVCHEVSRDASAAELEKIRSYVGDAAAAQHRA